MRTLPKTTRTLARRLAVPALLLALAGCARQDQLYGALTERQANEMVALLQASGIAAHKEAREGGTYALTTQSEDFGRAMEQLTANGMPRGSFDTVGQIFKKEGFVSSPVEERARLTHAMSQELANTLQTIDGVVVARVHLAMPDKDPLADKARPASASVFIKHRAGRDLSGQVAQMKALVVNGVEGLPYDKVTVALFPADPAPAARVVPDAPASALNLPLAVAAGLGTLLLACAGVLWLLRRRSSPSAGGELLLMPQPAARNPDAKRA
jgi:type III secretion protein J